MTPTGRPADDTIRRIEYLPLDEITPAGRNPKRHDLDVIRASIDRFGFTTPALLDERTGRLVVGHGRLDVLRAMATDGDDPPAGVRRLTFPGGSWLVPVVRGWASTSDAEAEAYLVADNQLTMLGGWASGELAQLLVDLGKADADLPTLAGFDAAHLDELLRLVDGAEGARDALGEWAGMPEFEQDDRLGAYQVVVHFATDADADDFFARIERPRRSSMWWPQHDGLPKSDIGHVVVLRYTNIGMAGPNYWMFALSRSHQPPFVLNTRIYSCNLIRNDLPFRWHGRYNEDTILSLDMLKAGWCTVLFNAFLQWKTPTQKTPGGNTEAFYAEEGTLPKSRMLVALHPDVARLTRRFGRWHHYVDYRRFRSFGLIRRPDYEPSLISPYKLTKVRAEKVGGVDAGV